MKKLILLTMLVMMSVCFMACEETEEGVDNENDIIVRNYTDWDLWIMIDGSQRGRIEDDGIAKTMWDDIADGVHLIQAFKNDTYSDFHCEVETDYLEDREDFRWYLTDDDEYEGTKSGDC